MRPLIGLTHSIQQDERKLYMPASYANVIREAGGTPLILPLTRDEEDIAAYAALVDGLLLSGGDDADPRSYGEEQRWSCGDISPLRDDFEIRLVRILLEKYPHKPILGICRGAQMLNVTLGGTLYQDLKAQVPGCICHQQHQGSSYAAHGVQILAGTKLHEIYGDTQITANSFHHQAVKALADSLCLTATAADGVVEGFEMPDHPYFVGVQWHPELLVSREEHAAHKRLFSSFVEACKGSSSGDTAV